MQTPDCLRPASNTAVSSRFCPAPDTAPLSPGHRARSQTFPESARHMKCPISDTPPVSPLCHTGTGTDSLTSPFAARESCKSHHYRQSPACHHRSASADGPAWTGPRSTACAVPDRHCIHSCPQRSPPRCHWGPCGAWYHSSVLTVPAKSACVKQNHISRTLYTPPIFFDSKSLLYKCATPQRSPQQRRSHQFLPRCARAVVQNQDVQSAGSLPRRAPAHPRQAPKAH